MQQSSTTQSLHLGFWGLRTIVAYSHSSSQCLLVSTVFGMVSPYILLHFYMYTHASHSLLTDIGSRSLMSMDIVSYYVTSTWRRKLKSGRRDRSEMTLPDLLEQSSE